MGCCGGAARRNTLAACRIGVLPWAVFDGAFNMALDMAMVQWLERREETEDAPDTLIRFYGWSRPTVSMGMHQRVERALDPEAARRLGLPVVRRPSGGRAVLHDEELTYCVAFSSRSPLAALNVKGAYEVICGWLCDVLRTLVDGEVRIGAATGGECRGARRRSEGGASGGGAPIVACFEEHLADAIRIDGRKICGSAQRRLGGCGLQHGSLLLRIDYDLLAEVFPGRDPERRAAELRSEMVGLWELGVPASRLEAERLASLFLSSLPGGDDVIMMDGSFSRTSPLMRSAEKGIRRYEVSV